MVLKKNYFWSSGISAGRKKNPGASWQNPGILTHEDIVCQLKRIMCIIREECSYTVSACLAVPFSGYVFKIHPLYLTKVVQNWKVYPTQHEVNDRYGNQEYQDWYLLKYAAY